MISKPGELLGVTGARFSAEIDVNAGRIRGPRRRPSLSGGRQAKTRWSFNSDAFEEFLQWLSPNQEEAGRKYEQTRAKMVRFFAWRGCHISEELFDRTVDRVCRKIALGVHEFSVDVVAYCWAVGRFVLQEYWREVKISPVPEDLPCPEIKDSEKRECELERLEVCLNRLCPRDRDLITNYYRGAGRERIQQRKDLASSMGGMNAMRIQVCRIRARLRESFSNLAQDQPAD
jgi:hypothetical protein